MVLSTLFKIIKAVKYSTESAKKITEAVQLIYHNDAKALRILETIGARANPKYGHEIISAAVFYYKALASFNLDRTNDSIAYLDVVEKIPSWYVIYGRSTLNDIKEEARKLKFQILESQ